MPVRVALNYKIPLIFYAEHGESEYGGLVLNEESLQKRDLREVIEHQIGDFPQNWTNEQVKLNDLSPYIYPEKNEFKHFKVEALYFGYFSNGACLKILILLKKKFQLKTLEDRTGEPSQILIV